MRKTRTLAALGAALLVAGCSSDGSPRTALRVEVFYLNQQGTDYGIADVALGLEGSPDEVFGTERVAWRVPDDNGTVVFPCDPALNPYEVRVTPVGPYPELPEVLGGFGEAAPEGGNDFQNPGELTRSVECVADEETPVQFDVALMRPAQQGFVDFALNGGAGEVGDLVADLWFDASIRDPTQRVSSSVYGNSRGSLTYTAPCDVHDEAEATRPIMTVEIVGLYEDEVVATGEFDDPAPPNGIEHWEVGLIEKFATCEDNREVFLQLDVVVARVLRDDDVVRAGFEGVSCGAMWRCENGDADSGELEITCEGEEAAPTLHVDDLELRCDGADDVAIAPVGPPTFEALDEIRWATTLRVSPLVGAALSRTCRLSGRATAAPNDGVERWSGFDGDVLPAGHVHPTLTWDLPVADETGFVCQRARLGHGGSITVRYTPSDNAAPTHFDHVFAPAGAQQGTP